MWLFYYLPFERNYDVLKSNDLCILLNKNINFNQNWKIRHTVLERRTMCFSSYKNRKLKVKLWWVGACERKKTTFFVPLILSEVFLTFVFLSHCIVYWIHFQNIHTFTYYALFCLFLKSSKAFSASLNVKIMNTSMLFQKLSKWLLYKKIAYKI